MAGCYGHWFSIAVHPGAFRSVARTSVTCRSRQPDYAACAVSFVCREPGHAIWLLIEGVPLHSARYPTGISANGVGSRPSRCPPLPHIGRNSETPGALWATHKTVRDQHHKPGCAAGASTAYRLQRHQKFISTILPNAIESCY